MDLDATATGGIDRQGDKKYWMNPMPERSLAC